MWDLATGAELRTLQGHTDGVRSVAVTPDGARAVSGSWDKTLKVWDLEFGACVATFSCEAPATACAWSPADARTVVHFLRFEGLE